MDSNFKRNLSTFFGVSLLILIVSSTASYLSINSLLKSNGMVNHTQEVIYNLNEGAAVMIEAQTSVRGFIISGNNDFLEQYTNSEAKSGRYFDKLRRTYCRQ